MRIVALRKRHKESLDHVLVALLVDALEELVIPFTDNFCGGIQGMLIETFLKKFSFDPIRPEPVSLLEIGGPRRFLAVNLDTLGTGKVVRCQGQALVLGHTVLNSLAKSREDLAWSRQVSTEDIRSECWGKALDKLVDIPLGEIEMSVIEDIEIVFQNPLRHRLRLLGLKTRGILFRKGEWMEVMPLFQHPCYGSSNRRHVRGGSLFGGIGRRGTNPRNQQQEQQWKQRFCQETHQTEPLQRDEGKANIMKWIKIRHTKA